jgi:ABC-type lipoprotein release transport system permease subunit
VTGLGLAVSGLRHRRLRSVFLILSVGLAIAVLTVTLAVLSTTAELSGEAQGGDQELIVQPVASAGRFPIAYIDKIKKIPNAQPAWWVSVYRATDGGSYKFTVLGASDQYPEFTRDGWFVTTKEDADAWRKDKKGALVGIQTLEKMGWKVGDLVTVKLFRNSDYKSGATAGQRAAGEVTLSISGVAPSGFRSSYVVAHLEYVADQLNAQLVDNIDVRCPPGTCPAVADQIDETFANSTEPSQSTPISAFFERRLREMSAVPDLLTRVALLIVLITGFITANTVAMSLAERRSELATLRAIGYTRARIFRLIVAEAVLVCSIGGLIGAGVPLLLFRHHGLAVGGWALENVTVSPSMAAIGLGCAALLGLLAGLVPAVAASRRDVIAAMADN